MTLRIRQREENGDPMKAYLERLIKLVPSEVVGLYLTGRQVLLGSSPPSNPPPGKSWPWIIWTAIGFLAVVVVRVWMTSDPRQKLGPQWTAVAIASVSYLIWVYSMGDVFTFAWNGHVLWDSRLAQLMVLAWTFFVPFFYTGEKERST